MLSPYTGILVMTVSATLFLLFMLLISTRLGPKNPTKVKQIPFECGVNPIGDVRQQRFGVRFYLVAVLFILFDVEVIFMYPWAVVLTTLGAAAFWQMLSFVAVLTVGLIYVWRTGVLDWND